MGERAVQNYFKGLKPNPIYDLVEGVTDIYKKNNSNMEFLQDGLFCEYAYVYNQENDTLEIYRGFFKSKQNFELEMELAEAIANGNIDKINAIKTLKVVESEYEEKGDKKDEIIKNIKRDYYCHLIFIVDKKIHTEEQVLKAFQIYDDWEERNESENESYPERNIIPLIFNKELRGIV